MQQNPPQLNMAQIPLTQLNPPPTQQPRIQQHTQEHQQVIFNAASLQASKCYNCNLPGHIANDCPTKTPRADHCYNCKDKNHRLPGCPHPPRRPCKRCGDSSHFDIRCPSNPQAVQYVGQKTRDPVSNANLEPVRKIVRITAPGNIEPLQ